MRTVTRTAVSVFGVSLALAGCSVDGPGASALPGADPLLSVDIPEGFTFATSRPLTIRADMSAEAKGRTLAEVRLADGSMIYRGPLVAPASMHVPVGTAQLQVSLRTPDGSRDVVVDVEGDEAVVLGQ